MSWTDLPPLSKVAVGGPVVSARVVQKTRGPLKVSIYLNALAAEKLSGSEFAHVQRGALSEAKADCLRIVSDPAGAHKIRTIIRNARRVEVPWFDGLPKVNCLNLPCDILTLEPGEVIIRLPVIEWQNAVSRMGSTVKPVASPKVEREDAKRVLPIVKPSAPSVIGVDERVDAVAYLKKKGVTVIDLGGGRYRIDESPASFVDVLSEVNAARRKSGLGDLTADQVR